MKKRLQKRKKKEPGKKYILIFFIALSVIVVDRITKVLALEIKDSIPLIKNVFHLTLVKNTGAAWGFFHNQNSFLIIMGLLVVFLLLYFIPKFEDIFYVNLCLGFIIGGSIGNLIDRIFLNYVIDFVDLRVWPVFNIADSFVFVGAILLVYYFIFELKD